VGLVRGTGGVNLGTHLLGVKANNERRDVDDLLSNTERRGTSRGKERGEKRPSAGIPSWVTRMGKGTHRMCLCLMRTLAWWMLLASPLLKTCVCSLLSKKSSTLRART
jgi:hypothetical protein